MKVAEEFAEENGPPKDANWNLNNELSDSDAWVRMDDFGPEVSHAVEPSVKNLTDIKNGGTGR